MNRMKVKRPAIILAGVAITLLLTGCATMNQRQQTATKPANIPEPAVMTAKAEPGTQWVHGEWQWDGHSWIWITGHWE
jgi:hypothetical protein